MRILFTTFPGMGHFLPIVPLAWAARAAGHEVLVLTTGQALEASDKAGLPAVDAAPGLNVMSVFQNELREKFQGGHPMGAHPGTADPLSNPKVWGIVAERMANVIDKMTDRTVQAAKLWRPDVIVHTPIEGAGPIAAEILSIPSVLHGIGPTGLRPMSLEVGLVSHIYDALAPTFQRVGLTTAPKQPVAALDICPPSMRGPNQGSAWSMRYVPYNGGGALPEWLLNSSRRRICVTLGTVVPKAQGVNVLAGVLEAVGDIDAEVILALGNSDPALLENLPSNVRTTGWIPLSELVPTCKAIVHHGGSGTTMNALVAGVPQLVLPHMADQHMNAAAVKRRGAGLTYLPKDADPQTVYNSLQQLLESPNFSLAADEVRQENGSMPSPIEIIPRIEQLIR